MWGFHYPWARTRGARGLFTTPFVVCCSGRPTCLWASDFCPSARPGPRNIWPRVTLIMMPDARSTLWDCCLTRGRPDSACPREGHQPPKQPAADLNEVGGCSYGILEGVGLVAHFAVQVPVLAQIPASPHMRNRKDHAPAQKHPMLRQLGIMLDWLLTLPCRSHERLNCLIYLAKVALSLKK